MKMIIITTIMYFFKNVNINNIKILHYDKIDIPEGIDVNTTNI